MRYPVVEQREHQGIVTGREAVHAVANVSSCSAEAVNLMPCGVPDEGDNCRRHFRSVRGYLRRKGLGVWTASQEKWTKLSLILISLS